MYIGMVSNDKALCMINQNVMHV